MDSFRDFDPFRDSRIGDFVRIFPSPIGNYFMISEIDGDNKVMYIHPGSRPNFIFKIQFKTLSGREILTIEIADPNGDHGVKFLDAGESPFIIGLNNTHSGECIDLKVSHRTFTDFRIVREIITEFAFQKEYEAKKMGLRKSFFAAHVNPYTLECPKIYKAYTKLGAIVAFMNHLETLECSSLHDYATGYMWDQIDPNKYSLELYESLEDMMQEFEKDAGSILQNIERPIEFPGPLQTSYITKPARD